MRILVTGANGYIGSTLVPMLADAGHKVMALDNNRYNQVNEIPFVIDRNITYREHDCTVFNEFFIKEIERSDVIVWLAAIVGAPACSNFPKESEKINVTAVSRLLDYIQPDTLLEFPVTNSMYGNNPGISTEESEVNCLSGYSSQKYRAEQLIKSKHQNSICFRLATVFGPSPRMRLDLLVNQLSYLAFFDKKIELFDESFRRNYISVHDVARAFIHGIEEQRSMKSNVYNVGQCTKTKAELALAVKSVINCQIINSKDKTDEDKRDAEISCDKIAETGYSPIVDLESGITQLIDYYDRLPKNKEDREKLTRYMRNV